MTEEVKFRCLNCGHRFVQEVLTEKEKREQARERLQSSPVSCPECGRTDVRRGWE